MHSLVLLKKQILLFLFGLLFPTLIFAQKFSNEFLSIGVSARAQAMGNAVVASVNDVTAGYWNPAGLATFSADKGLQLGAMHSEQFGGVAKFDYLAATIPLTDRTKRMGFSIIRFGIDNIPNTLSLFEADGTINFDNIVEFSAADYAFLISYAQPLKLKSDNKLYVGGNVKVIRRIIGSFADSWGFGLDLGAQYHMKKLKIGLMARDITSTFNAWHISFTDKEKDVLLATGNELPDINSVEITRPQFLVGIAYPFKFNKVTILPEFDFVATTDGKRNTLITGDPVSIDPAFGIEVNYNSFVFLRAGVNQFQDETNFQNKKTLTARPSIGIGLQISSLRMDYAFTDVGDSQSRFSHIVSLLLDLKPKKK